MDKDHTIMNTDRFDCVFRNIVMRENCAIRLRRLSKKTFRDNDELAIYVPQRESHYFAMHPQKWEPTFYSLTNKDSSKICYYRPEIIDIHPDTIIADMRYANLFFWATNDYDRSKNAELYQQSVRLLIHASVDEYHLPELLIPRDPAEASCHI